MHYSRIVECSTHNPRDLSAGNRDTNKHLLMKPMFHYYYVESLRSSAQEAQGLLAVLTQLGPGLTAWCKNSKQLRPSSAGSQVILVGSRATLGAQRIV